MESRDQLVKDARDAELRRCRALESGDMAAVAELLHPELIYVHSNGAIDGRASFVARASEVPVRFLRCERRDLQAWCAGDTVFMSGEMITAIQLPPSPDTVETAAFLTQAYVHDSNGWRMIMLHASENVQDSRGG